MSNLPQTSLGRYQYTALDKLSVCTLGAQPGSQRFYLGERLSTELQGAVQHSVMQNGEQLLAQQQRQAGTLHTQLLATDQQRSVLTLLDASRPQHLAYSPYGHRAPENGLLSLLGFNGERPDPLTGWYLLGNGYRAFNPVLMRFNSPDSWSPFGRGGLNAYGYCVGDPVNQSDPTGHLGNPIKGIMNLIGLRTPSTTGKIKDLSVLAENIYTFNEKTKSGTRLTIAGHGTGDSIDSVINIKSGNEEWSANYLYEEIAMRFNLNKVGDIRLLVCGSANGNKSSFAQEFSNLSGKPVIGFKNNVDAKPRPEYVMGMWERSKAIPGGEKHFRNHPELQRYLIKRQTPRTFKPNIR